MHIRCVICAVSCMYHSQTAIENTGKYSFVTCRLINRLNERYIMASFTDIFHQIHLHAVNRNSRFMDLCQKMFLFPQTMTAIDIFCGNHATYAIIHLVFKLWLFYLMTNLHPWLKTELIQTFMQHLGSLCSQELAVYLILSKLFLIGSNELTTSGKLF